MRRLTLAALLISPLATALEITNLTYSNIREGSIAGRVTADMTFTIDYRNFRERVPDPLGNLRTRCTPSQPASASIYNGTGNFTHVLAYNQAVPIAPPGNSKVTLAEVFAEFTPVTASITTTIVNVVPEELIYFSAGMGDSDYCRIYDLTTRRAPKLSAECDINVQSDVNHGSLSLPSVGDEHIANGAVQVTCNSRADVTVSTGQTGTIRINDTLSTDISVNGSPNSATKTVDGTEIFTVASRLHRTSASDWGGSFDHPVIMTISWP